MYSEIGIYSCSFDGAYLNVALVIDGKRTGFSSFGIYASPEPVGRSSNSMAVKHLLGDDQLVQKIAIRFECDLDALKSAINRFLKFR